MQCNFPLKMGQFLQLCNNYCNFAKIVPFPKNHASYIIIFTATFLTWSSFENIIKLRKHILCHTWSFLDENYVILRDFLSFGFAKLLFNDGDPIHEDGFLYVLIMCAKKPLKNLLLFNPDPCTILDKLRRRRLTSFRDGYKTLLTLIFSRQIT